MKFRTLKKILSISTVLILFNCKSTQNIQEKVISINEIVFLKEAVITNKVMYDDSSYDYVSKFVEASVEQVKKERKAQNKITNEVQSEVVKLAMIDQIRAYLVDKKYKAYKTEIFYNYQEAKNALYSKERDFSLFEYRNDTKIINDYKCFKIVVFVKKEEATNTSVGMPDSLINAITEYEMYVTDKIKNSYHPVIKYKSVLDKYYPLEIIEKDSNIKGAQINYKLLRLN